MPAHVVSDLTLGLALLPDDDYEEVATKVTGSLDRFGCWNAAWSVRTSSAITQALGRTVFPELFERTCGPVDGEASPTAQMAVLETARGSFCVVGGCSPRSSTPIPATGPGSSGDLGLPEHPPRDQPSSPRRPRPPTWTPTGSPSPKPSASSAAPPPARRAFPPQHWTDQLPKHLAGIADLLIPPRRERTCPRVVKRAQHNTYRVKKPTEPATEVEWCQRRLKTGSGTLSVI